MGRESPHPAPSALVYFLQHMTRAASPGFTFRPLALLSLNNRERAHWKRSEAFHFHGHREEPKGVVRQLIEVTQVLDNRNSDAKQDAVRWSRQIGGVINVV